MITEHKSLIKRIVKDWMLVIGMSVGAGIYLIYHSIPALAPLGPVFLPLCKGIQPWLLFAMLFLSFCKIEPHQLRPHKWHLWLLIIQGSLFILLSLAIVFALRHDGRLAQRILALRIPLEAALLCLICPTATACAVVTGKLGGNMAGVVTYTILINLLAAILIPSFIPLLYPENGISFISAFNRILAKVFPLLIMPCLCAWLIRYLLPDVHRWILKYSHMSFYIWCVSLAIAIMLSTRAIIQYEGNSWALLEIAVSSLICCVFQFWCGWKIGNRYGCRISAGQAMGQKNTVFAIWVGYSFMSPILSVAGGFYSIWHNCLNTWQLNKRRKELESK